MKVIKVMVVKAPVVLEYDVKGMGRAGNVVVVRVLVAWKVEDTTQHS